EFSHLESEKPLPEANGNVFGESAYHLSRLRMKDNGTHDLNVSNLRHSDIPEAAGACATITGKGALSNAHVLDLLRRHPLIAKGIQQARRAIAVELVGGRPERGRARLDRAPVLRVAILDLQVETARLKVGRFAHFEHGISDPHGSVHHAAVLFVNTQLLRAESPLQEINERQRFRRVRIGENGAHTLGGDGGRVPGREVPIVAGEVFHKPGALAVGPVRRLAHGGSTRLDGALVGGVAIRHVDVKCAYALVAAEGLPTHYEEVGIADFDCGDEAVNAVWMPVGLLRIEGSLQEFDQAGRLGHGDKGCDGAHTNRCDGRSAHSYSPL